MKKPTTPPVQSGNLTGTIPKFGHASTSPKDRPFDLLAYAMVRTTPQFTRWVFGMGPRPSLHSPENIGRLLDFHAEQLTAATSDLAEAKKAVQAGNLKAAKLLVKKSFAGLAASAALGDDLLALLAELQSERKGKAQ
jgi:hypothetical protein